MAESGAMHEYKRIVRKQKTEKRPKRKLLRSKLPRTPKFRKTGQRIKHSMWPK